MKMISIDQSFSATAWVLWEDCVMIDWGVISSNKEKDKHLRIMDISNGIVDIIKENQVELMVLEGLSFGSNNSTSARDLAGLYYELLIMSELQGIEWEELAPTSIKKFATGSGRAKKQDMWNALPDNIKQKFERTNKTIKSGRYDLADSYFIGVLALTNLKRI